MNNITPLNPIKTTCPLNKLQIKKLEAENEQIRTNFVELDKNPAPTEEYRRVTVVMAMTKSKPKPNQSSKASKKKIFRVLLDSG